MRPFFPGKKKKTPGILTHAVKCSPDLSDRFAIDYLRDIVNKEIYNRYPLNANLV
jgi:hypothetical protein